MKGRLYCNCELKICRTDTSVSIEMCRTHDENSHAPEKDTSKFMNVAQIEAIKESEMPALISDDDDVEDPVLGPCVYVLEYGIYVSRNCCVAIKSLETPAIVCATHMHDRILPVVKHAVNKRRVDWQVID